MDIRNTLIFVIGLVVTVLTIWVGYIIVFGFNLAFDLSAPTYNDIFSGLGLTSFFDQVTYFNYLELYGIIAMVMSGELLTAFGMIIQWIVVAIILGFWIGLFAMGSKMRVGIFTAVIILATQLIIVILNPTTDLHTYGAVMVLINTVLILGFAIVFNALWKRVLWKTVMGED